MTNWLWRLLGWARVEARRQQRKDRLLAELDAQAAPLDKRMAETEQVARLARLHVELIRRQLHGQRRRPQH